MKNDTSLFSLRNIKILTNMQKKFFWNFGAGSLNCGSILDNLEINPYVRTTVLYYTVLWSGKKIQPQKMVLKKGPVNLMVEKFSISCPTLIWLLKTNVCYTEKVTKFTYVSCLALHLLQFAPPHWYLVDAQRCISLLDFSPGMEVGPPQPIYNSIKAILSSQ